MTASIEFRRPGVTVQEVPLPRDTGTVTGTGARAVIIGYLERGPSSPTVVSSWLQFQMYFGSWSDDLTNNRTVDAVYSYFSNASSNASSLIVQRVLLSGAATAQLAVKDAAGAEAHTLFTLHAISPGAWGNRLRVLIKDTRPPGGGQFAGDEMDGSEFLTGASDPGGGFAVQISLVDDNGAVVGTPETFYNLSTSNLSRTYYESVINAGSKLVRAVPAAGVTTFDPPVALAEAAALAGGLDSSGASPTLGLATALEKLNVYESPLALYAPSRDSSGNPIPANTAAVVNYAESRGDSFVVADTSRIGTSDSIISEAASISNKSAFVAVYYPWIVVNDPLRGSANVRKVVPPGGAVLGAYMNVDSTYGPWRSPGGAAAPLRDAVSVDKVLTETELQAFNSAGSPVNALRGISGSGVCIMGARTLDPTNADRYVGIRRSLNFITVNLKRIAEQSLFEPNGPDLWDLLTRQMENWLGLYYQQGALRGSREPEAFKVVIGGANNTAATVASGELHIDVGVAVEFPAEFVIIRLTQHQGGIRS